MKRLTVTQKRWLLFAHILFTIGWLGPGFCYWTVAVFGAFSMDPGLVKAAFTVFRLLDQTLVLTAALGTLITGVLLSLLTSWGLTRWYWIIVKAVATPICILLEIFAMDSLLKDASIGAMPPGRLVGAFTGHLIIMSSIVVLSVLKPWGQRRASEIK